jgi:hypothetical protein
MRFSVKYNLLPYIKIQEVNALKLTKAVAADEREMHS